MRTIQLHPLSLLVGGAAAVLALLTMAQNPLGGGSIHAVPAPQCQELLVEYGPHPRDYVQIKEGEAYVVPPAKAFTLTALGGTREASSLITFYVDGQDELGATSEVTAYASGGFSPGPSTMKATPLGLTVSAGSTITLGGGEATDDARAWGYLVDA